MSAAFEVARRAAALLEAGRNNDAETLARQALETDPHNAMALEVLTSALLHQDKTHEALATSKLAIAASPNGVQANLLYTAALLESSKRRQALDAARRLVELAPFQSSSHSMSARALIANRKSTDARESAERAVSLDPTDPDAHHMVGYVALSDRRFEHAKQAYAKALELDPNNALYMMNLAIAQHELGDRTAALETMGRSVEANPRDELVIETTHSLAKIAVPMSALGGFLIVQVIRFSGSQFGFTLNLERILFISGVLVVAAVVWWLRVRAVRAAELPNLPQAVQSVVANYRSSGRSSLVRLGRRLDTVLLPLATISIVGGFSMLPTWWASLPLFVIAVGLGLRHWHLGRHL